MDVESNPLYRPVSYINRKIRKPDYNDGRYVTELTDANFDETIKTYDFVLVYIYSVYLLFDRERYVTYRQAAKAIASEKLPILVAKISGYSEIGKRYDIINTNRQVILFRKGKAIDFTDIFELDCILTWVQNRLHLFMVCLDTIKDVLEFSKENSTCMVGFFRDLKSNDAEIYTKVANENAQFPYGISPKCGMIGEHRIKRDSIVVFKKSGERVMVFDKTICRTKIKRFMYISSLPTFVEFRPDSLTRNHIIRASTEHLCLFVTKAQGHMDAYVKPLQQVAERHESSFVFLVLDSDDKFSKNFFKLCGIRKDTTPTFRMIRHDFSTWKAKTFRPQNDSMTPENLKKFLNQYLGSEISEYYASEALTANWQDKLVKSIVADNYQKVTMDKSKNVVVFLYKPDMEMTDYFTKMLEHIAHDYQDEKDLLIARIDATANRMKNLKVDKIPSILLYKKDTNERRTLSVFDWTGLRDFVEFNGEMASLESMARLQRKFYKDMRAEEVDKQQKVERRKEKTEKT